jgi:hypothetical protein
MYFSSMAGGWTVLFWLLILVGTLTCEGLNSVQTWFLGYWAGQYELFPADQVNVV